MVSNELKQLLNGESVYSRDQAPEPLLLPRIASRIATEGIGFTAYAANTLSNHWVPYGWSALADATAEAIAPRHAELDDSLLEELFDTLPQLPLALISLDEAAGQRAEAIVGGDVAKRLHDGLGDPSFILREAVSRIFREPDAPHTVDELMVLVRERTETESPEIQRNLLAYFLPLAPAAHRQWMIPILNNVLAIYPGWVAAAAASRLAGLLDLTRVGLAGSRLEAEDPLWAGHARDLLAGDRAGSVFLEVARAFHHDRRLENLLASEADPASLIDFVDKVLEGWGGAPPSKMAPMDEPETGDGDGPEEVPPPASASRGVKGFGFPPDDDFDAFGDDIDEVLLERSFGAPGAPPAAPEPPSGRSLQAQVSIDDDGVLIPVTQGFKTATRHDVRLWIGPQTKHGISADAPINEPTPDERELAKGSMEIVITLVQGSKPQADKVELPLDRTKKSKAAVFSLQVDSDSQFVSAEIWLQHKGRIIQYLKLNGLVLEEPDNTSTGIKLRVESLIRAIPEDASGGNFEMALVKKDDKYIVFGPRGAEKTEVSLQGAGDIVEKINKKLFTATKGLVRHSADNRGTSWVHEHDEDAMQLLREMARWGNALYDALKKEGVLERISETIQFVNLDETDIVPIEYVYDRGYPKDGATLCAGFREAGDWDQIFASGKCTCSNQALVESDTLCPMGFWSLSKVIERQSRPRGTARAESATGFIAPSGASPAIALGRQAVLAAAPNVNSLDVESVRSMLEETYPNRYKLATDWQQWETEVRQKSPRLLVLLPHHGEAAEGHTDFLEIGSPGQKPGDRLYAGLLTENYVTGSVDETGPVVLLLGCETAQSDLLPFHTFARDFLANRASIVVATQSSILGQHAAPVANEFIRQLLAATQTSGSFGKIMRNVRQKMFAGGYLMSLALVSFGDSDWKLGSSTSSGPDEATGTDGLSDIDDA